MSDYSIFTFVDNDNYNRIITSKITSNKNLALSDAASDCFLCPTCTQVL